MRFPKNLVPLKRFPPPPLAERLPGNPVFPGSRVRSAERRQGNRRRVRRPKRARASAAGAGACPRCGAGGRAGPGCGRYTVRSEGGVRNGRRPFGRGGDDEAEEKAVRKGGGVPFVFRRGLSGRKRRNAAPRPRRSAAVGSCGPLPHGFGGPGPKAGGPRRNGNAPDGRVWGRMRPGGGRGGGSGRETIETLI